MRWQDTQPHGPKLLRRLNLNVQRVPTGMSLHRLNLNPQWLPLVLPLHLFLLQHFRSLKSRLTARNLSRCSLQREVRRNCSGTPGCT